jgi:hypothetical protein
MLFYSRQAVSYGLMIVLTTILTGPRVPAQMIPLAGRANTVKKQTQPTRNRADSQGKRPATASPRSPLSGAKISAGLGESLQSPWADIEQQEQTAARKSGARLLSALQIRKLELLNPERDLPQIQQLSVHGYYTDPDGHRVTFAPILLKTLERLTNLSSPRQPLLLMSLYRPLSSDNPDEPHGNGMAMDIVSFAGHPMDSRKPHEAIAGVIAVVNALERGEYRLGLPKSPAMDPIPLLPPPPRPAAGPFFPAPVPNVLPLPGTEIVLPRLRSNHPVLDRNGRLVPQIKRWENERGAPLSEIGDMRVRLAIKAALGRGANIYSLFPDALDHLHLDVRPIRSASP